MELKFPPFYDIYKKLKIIYFELNVGKMPYFFYFFDLFRKITKLFSLRSIYKADKWVELNPCFSCDCNST